MKVIKRNGNEDDMKFDRITSRINTLSSNLSVEPDKITQTICSSMYDGITTKEIDILSADVCIAMMTESPDYETLAARIIANNIQKSAPGTFCECAHILHSHNILSDEVYNICCEHASELNKIIKKSRDYDYGFFGLKTLERSYLQTIDNVVIETPQYMFMRVSLGIHKNNINAVKETYDYMSSGYFIHATPTLYNSGTPRPQMSSCFLLSMKDDSIDGIYDTIKECAQISKWAGGIGLNVHDIRSKNSKIYGTNGKSDGIIPMLRVLNATARYVNQAGRRKGSIAVYLEPWHADILDFLELRLNSGNEDSRCRDLFTGLWIPDLFMKRLVDNGSWSLFCPNVAKGLSDVYGEAFESLYLKYENMGIATEVVPASKIWMAILKSQTETGTPYMLYKDACNYKSNQKNLGVIKNSNLCTEIIEYTDPDETAVCNLASIALPKFIHNNIFNFQKLYQVTRIITRNLNKVIDENFYPVETAKKSNMRHRPIGIGVQGLADVFNILGIAFDSDEASTLNVEIFETIYHASLKESSLLAKEHGIYESYPGSPASKGLLQFDLWDNKPKISGRWDWEELKKYIHNHGLRNSLLIAPMPTASTSQILGNNECIEPYTTNIYLRRTIAGEFIVVNKNLVKALQKLNLWTPELKDMIIKNNGSIQDIPNIPDNIKTIYKTVWEISQRKLIDMASDRGHFIDQSQSMNLFMENPTVSKLSSMHIYSWKKGLKTGIYYLRTKAKAKAQQFSIDPTCIACSA